MKNKRIVITGSPGAGKTSIIKGLEDKGYSVFEEYSRTLIDEGKATGKANFFLSNPEEFSELLFSGRKAQFNASSSLYVDFEKPFVFFDRGILDIYAYLLAVKGRNDFWGKRIIPLKYDLVFWLSPGKKSIKKTVKEWKHLLKLNVTFLILKIYISNLILLLQFLKIR